MISSLYPQKSSTSSISNLENLAESLSLDKNLLEYSQKLTQEERYKKIKIPKSNNSYRTVHDPSDIIRKIQNRINTRIFTQLVDWPDYLFGSIPNDIIDSRDYISCARKHCLAKSIFKLDISNFYDNIHRDFVYDIFNNFFKFPTEVSDFLTDICCYDDYLPQGALTSSYIATLCFWNVEGDLVKRFQRKNLVYTRLVDDITVSSKKHDYDFEYVEKHIKNMLLHFDFPVNNSKTKIMRDGLEPLNVHGLRVNYPEPRLPSAEVNKIRAAVHNVVKMSKINNYRTSKSYRNLYDRALGRVNKLARVGHNKHSELINKLKKVTPLPSKRDLNYIKNNIRTLKNLNELDCKKLRQRKYKRKYHLINYRISILNRTFPNKASTLRNELKLLKDKILDKQS
ncbi:reverse transcriptase family protein [Shewanella algae]